MKKSRISLILLSAISVGALVGCGPDKKPTTGPDTTPVTTPTPTPSTTPAPTPVGATSIKDLIENYFTGDLGKYDKNKTDNDGYLFTQIASKAEVVHTLEVTYLSGGEGRYYDSGRQGYLTDESGAFMMAHLVDTAKFGNSFTTDIVPGAKLRISGKVEAYHGFPQFSQGWTYEVIEAAPADVSALDLLYKEVTIADLVDTDGQIKSSQMTKPVLLKNMVMKTSDFGFVPLSDIDNDKAPMIKIYNFGNGSVTIRPGKLYDIYAFTTAYKGTAQLHAHPNYSSEVFQSLREREASTLTDAQNLQLQSLYTSIAGISSEVTFNYIDNPGETLPNQTFSLLSPYVKDVVTSSHKLTKPQDAKTTISIGTDMLKQKRLEIKPLSDLDTYSEEEIKETFTITHRVCLAKDAADDEACWGLTDPSKYTEEIKTITVKHLLKVKSVISATLVKSLPESISYITNNSSYPKPSFAYNDENANNALNLAFPKGGFINAEKLVGSQKIQLDLDFYVRRYDKSGSTPANDSARKSEITIDLLGEDGKTVLNTIVPSQNLFDATKVSEDNVPTKQTLTLELDTGDATKLASYIRITVKTATNATLYVEGVTYTSLNETPTPDVPGPDSGASKPIIG